MFRRLLFATCVISCVGTFAAESNGQATPIVAELPLNRIPGMNVGPKSANVNTRKVVAYGGLVFVPYSIGADTIIVGYDRSEVPRVRRDIKGAKLMKNIEIDAQKKVVRFVGEGDRTHNMPWSKLSASGSVPANRKREADKREAGTHEAVGESPEEGIWNALGGNLKELQDMTRSLKGSQLTNKTRNSADGSSAILSKLNRLAKNKELSFEDVERAQMEMAEFDLSKINQLLGGASSASGKSEPQSARELERQMQLIENLRSNMKSDGLPGTKQQQRDVLDALNKGIKKRQP